MANQENSIQRIEEGVVSFSKSKVTIKKSFDYKGLAWFALGVIMLAAQVFDKEDGALTMSLLAAGLSLAIYGIIKFLVKKTGYYYGALPMTMYSFTFDADRYAEIMTLYDAGDFDKMTEIPRKSDAKMMLKILVDNNFTVAYSQVFKFTNQTYDFEPQCEIREHTPSECQKINTLVISY